MNQLDYHQQPSFAPGAFQQQNQALAAQPYAQNSTAQQQQGGGQQFQQGQQIGAQNAIFNLSPGQASGPYTSAPYGQTIPATAQLANVRQSASPQQAGSPFTQQAQQPVKYPMAAPPLPQTPTSATQNFSPLHASGPGTPQSPGGGLQDSERIQLMLEINAQLFEEVNSLQSQGKGGAVNPKQAEELKANNMDASMASEEYINALRRVQANLSYLASKGNTNQTQNLPGPAHMTPPPHMPQLQAKYDKLKELFPGWAGLDGRNASAARTAATSAPNGMAS